MFNVIKFLEDFSIKIGEFVENLSKNNPFLEIKIQRFVYDCELFIHHQFKICYPFSHKNNAFILDDIHKIFKAYFDDEIYNHKNCYYFSSNLSELLAEVYNVTDEIIEL